MQPTFVFAPSAGTTVGKSVKVTANNTPTSVAGALSGVNVLATCILVTNTGTVLVYVRVSTEATPAATVADVPVPAGSNILLANPAPYGVAGLAVLSSTTTVADVYFTPGTTGGV